MLTISRYAYPSAQIHEIGHNLNLGHSNEKKSYDDTTYVFSVLVCSGAHKIIFLSIAVA